MLELDRDAAQLIAALNGAGFAAYAVGGCVRDLLRGVQPHDWDLCTQATPEQVEAVFSGNTVLKTGVRHGTVTVRLNHRSFEITTFRADGAYRDHRRPGTVRFCSRVEEDLARRDFTVNAMAYHPDDGLIDPYGGRADLENRVLRCVGQPEKRLEEDSLRILRLLRFSAALGFVVEKSTGRAARAQADKLQYVSAERKYDELSRMLIQPFIGRVLRSEMDILFSVLPELRAMQGLDQRNPHHLWDVWEHTVRAVELSKNERIIRWALLFHDSGKPASFTVDEAGVGHFYGHPDRSAQLVWQAMEQLKADKATRECVWLLVKKHDVALGETPQLVRRRLAQLGESALRALLHIKKCDAVGQGTHPQRIVFLQQWERMLNDILAEAPCLTTRDLAVGGRELMELGLRGEEIGQAQRRLLEHVLSRPEDNTRERLLAVWKEREKWN